MLAENFYTLLNTHCVEKTHLFNGRYENIYIAENKIPQITPLIKFAKQYLHEHANLESPEQLKAGFWFNLMSPGDVTLVHTHDDDSEVYSGVYYVTVPQASGDLLLYNNSESCKITPRAGEFIFFLPDLKHEVTKNLADEKRLSIGFNFGY